MVGKRSSCVHVVLDGTEGSAPSDAIATHSTLIESARPSSCRICRSSAARLSAEPAVSVTEKSSPILRSEPERSLGRILVPSRLQTSGGIAPVSRRILLAVTGVGSGGFPGAGSGGEGASGTWGGCGCARGDAGFPALSASAAGEDTLVGQAYAASDTSQ